MIDANVFEAGSFAWDVARYLNQFRRAQTIAENIGPDLLRHLATAHGLPALAAWTLYSEGTLQDVIEGKQRCQPELYLDLCRFEMEVGK